ncbi:MAG: hypothetical protein WEF86_02920, partial [Gemmatimonadota bacterium]
YLIQAACANISLLMRQLTGCGTPKQALAASGDVVMATLSVFLGFIVLAWTGRPAEHREGALVHAAIT